VKENVLFMRFLGYCEGFKDDTCLHYKGIISVYVEEKDLKDVVNRLILRKSEEYIIAFNEENTDIFVSYEGPYLYSTDTNIQLWNVKRLMNEKEIKIFEDALYETFHSLPLKNPNQQDPYIDKVSVTNQVLIVSDRRQLQGGKFVDVDISVAGSCHDCSKEQFDLFTNDAIGDSYSSIEEKVKEKESMSDNNENYFQDVFVIPVGKNESSTSQLDSNATENGKKFPMYVIYGFLSGACILFIGIGYTVRKHRQIIVKKAPEVQQD
jgi:hypothetical protein